jgi:hypothetical protein
LATQFQKIVSEVPRNGHVFWVIFVSSFAAYDPLRGFLMEPESQPAFEAGRSKGRIQKADRRHWAFRGLTCEEPQPFSRYLNQV